MTTEQDAAKLSNADAKAAKAKKNAADDQAELDELERKDKIAEAKRKAEESKEAAAKAERDAERAADAALTPEQRLAEAWKKEGIRLAIAPFVTEIGKVRLGLDLPGQAKAKAILKDYGFRIK